MTTVLTKQPLLLASEEFIHGYQGQRVELVAGIIQELPQSAPEEVDIGARIGLLLGDDAQKWSGCRVPTNTTAVGEKEPQMTVPEVRALLHHLVQVRVWDSAEILRWSRWRQERNRRAAASHRKRRAAELRRRARSRSRPPALGY